jgi:hypothetical protein
MEAVVLGVRSIHGSFVAMVYSVRWVEHTVQRRLVLTDVLSFIFISFSSPLSSRSPPLSPVAFLFLIWYSTTNSY